MHSMGDALEWTHAGRRRRHPFLRDERRRAHPNDEESVSGTRAPLWSLSSLRVLVLLRLRPSFHVMHILSWSTRPGLGHVGLPATRTLAGTGACWRDWDGPARQGTRRGSRTQSAARPTLCLSPTCVLRPARRSGLRWNGAMRAKPWRPRRSFSSYTSKYTHTLRSTSPGAHRSSEPVSRFTFCIIL